MKTFLAIHQPRFTKQNLGLEACFIVINVLINSRTNAPHWIITVPCICSDEEIIEEVHGTAEEEATEQSEDKDAQHIPSASETWIYLQTALRYFEARDIVPVKSSCCSGLLQWANKISYD